MTPLLQLFLDYLAPALDPDSEVGEAFLYKNAFWFVRIRWIAVVLGVLLVLVGYQFGLLKSWSLTLALLAGFGLLGLANGVLNFRIRNKEECSRDFLLGQVIIDLSILTYLLVLSGGLGNPLFLFYLVHVIIGGILFRKLTTHLISLGVGLLVALFIGLHYLAPFYIYQSSVLSGFLFINETSALITGGAFLTLVFFASLFTTQLMNELRTSQQKLKEMAKYDDLTGALNREFFSAQVQEIINGNPAASHAMLYLDLDGFKQINDAYGHSVGDGVLQTFTDRIRALVSNPSILGRWGGDEFTLLVPEVKNRDALVTKIYRLIEKAQQPIQVGQHEISLRLSVGVALNPEHGTTPNELITRADTAMYEAKQEAGSAYEYFKPAFEKKVKQEIRLEDELNRALEEGNIQAVYQPIVSSSEGNTAGYETLGRWHHPERGNISPGRFIPVAEASGLIHDLGCYVFSRLCERIKRTSHRGEAAPFFSVNVSGLELIEGTTVEQFPRIAHEHSVSPERIVIEVTETSMIERLDETVEQLKELREEGFRIAVDDFGTGYSSLAYLLNFPVDLIKIDRSFVMGLPESGYSRKLIELVRELSNTLDAELIAEGVETREQWDIVAEFCEYGQGFLFKKPAESPEPVKQVS